MNFPPRLAFAHLPTPLEPLPRLTKHLGGAEIWIKRDDQTGLAGGGNKTRKLEYLLADAQSQKAHTLITGGAPQSNHCRQTAAAAARYGFRCILALRGDPPAKMTGNILLDGLLGAEIVWTHDESREAVMQAVYEKEKAAGNDPVIIPIGGSNKIGAAAYVAAVQELAAQVETPRRGVSTTDGFSRIGAYGGAAAAGKRGVSTTNGFSRICFASSSGGTHAGLAVGAKALMPGTQVLGFSVDEPLEVLKQNVARLSTETAALLDLPYTFNPSDIVANADYIGAGYALMGDQERETIRLLATLEGVLVDPVYTGKAFGGMIDLIRKGEIRRDERVLFWHTGGQPTLFAYEDQLLG